MHKNKYVFSVVLLLTGFLCLTAATGMAGAGDKNETMASPEAGETITWWVTASGGGTATAPLSSVSGTIGQTATVFISATNGQLQSGFWPTLVNTSCCVDRVGDANGQGGDEPTIGDASVMIDAKFITLTCDGILECLPEADVNQSGGNTPECRHVTISDIQIMIDYLFITGPSLGLPDCL